MGRYTYNAGLVSQALDVLGSAASALDDTNTDVQKGINTIYNARGSENMMLDDAFNAIKSYQSQVIEYIDTVSGEISKKAQEIEEWNDTPWYKKLFATIGLGALKLVEGLGTFVENIGDCLVAVTGFIGGVFSSKFRDACGEFVKKDWVGDAFADGYEGGILSDINKYSYMSHTSTAANVLKGVGVAAGYVIISVATAGAGTAVSLGVSTATAVAGGIGSGTQAGLQAGKTFNQAFGQGVKDGLVAGATTLVTGAVANKITSMARASKVLKAVDQLDESAKALKELGKAASGSAKGVGIGAQLSGSIDELTGAVHALNSVDEAGNAIFKVGQNTVAQADDVLRAAEKLKTLATTANLTDDAVAQIDDMIKLATNTANTAKSAAVTQLGKKAAGVLKSSPTTVADAKALKAAEKAAANLDETATAVAGSADEAKTILQKGKDVLQTGAKKVGDLGKAAATKVDDALTNALSGKGISGNAGKIIGTVEKVATVGAGVGAAGINVGQKITAQMGTNEYRLAMDALENPNAGVQLYEQTYLDPSAEVVTEATSQQAAENLKEIQELGFQKDAVIQDDGTVVYPTSPEDTITSDGTTSVTVPTTPGYEYPTEPSYTPTYTQPGIDIPTNPSYEYPTNPSYTTPVDPSVDPINPGYDPGVNPGVDPGNNGGNGGGGYTGDTPYIDPGTSVPTDIIGAVEGDYEIDTNLVSDDIMTTLGSATGALGEMESGVSIPTSSAPILSSGGVETKSQSFIPITAGLGAAGVAGIGAKAYLDKKEKEGEEEEEIEAEEYDESTNSLAFEDTGAEDSEENDYLMPTDEFAFQEN